jgi:hypothetical protein
MSHRVNPRRLGSVGVDEQGRSIEKMLLTAPCG